MTVTPGESCSPAAVRIGDRVVSGVDRATVKYVGAVGELAGEWLGVDWDDGSRGRHDGAHEGVRYFSARSATSGSFVRRRLVARGVSLMEAVRERYGLGADEVDSARVGGKQVEAVGMESVAAKQRRFERLRHVILDDGVVSECGDADELTAELPQCFELDLCHNLLRDVETAARMAQALPRLRQLNLSRNLFSLPMSDCKLVCSNVSTLTLNECRLTWTDAVSILRVFKNASQVGLARNEITCIQLGDSNDLGNITELDLEGNRLESFESVADLGNLPNLRWLNLTSVGLTTWRARSRAAAFPSLQTLYLGKNALSDWAAVDALDGLPALTCLVAHGNPLSRADTIATTRQLVIARVARLSLLDKQAVSQNERLGAEIDYLKKYANKWFATQEDAADAAFDAAHPRYGLLVRLHGEPPKPQDSTATSGVLKTRLLTVTLVCEAAAFRQEKTVPSTMSVQKLKLMAARLCRANARTIRLRRLAAGRPDLVIDLENDLRDLLFYSVETGDTISVTTL